MDKDKAIQLLKKHSTDEESFKAVLAHSKAVQEKALKVAERIKARNPDIAIDVDFIKSACILHDIGRFVHPPGEGSVKHGVAGAELLRSEGLDERYARVCERHLGAGIPADEVEKQGLPIPKKDYLPESVEERIIAYADNLTAGEGRASSEQAVKRFTDEIGEAAGSRVKKLHDDIEGMMQQE